HVMVNTNPQGGFTMHSRSTMNGFRGEQAMGRFRRLLEEERIPRIDPPSSLVDRMGPQGVLTPLQLMEECAAACGGVLIDSRERASLRLLHRDAMTNQTPTMVLDAKADEIQNPFTPILDDQRFVNSVIVSREGGGQAQIDDADSIAHEGRYESSTQLNLYADWQLPDAASWRLNIGLAGGVMRYASVSAELLNASQRVADWLATDIGSRIQVVGLPAQHPQST